MKMFLIVIVLVIGFIVAPQVYKDKARSELAPHIDKDILDKVFGKKGVKISRYKIPVIPKLEKNGLDISSLKDNKLSLKKSKYDKLTAKGKLKYQRAFLEELYYTVRNDTISEDKLIGMINQLNQGAEREGIYRSLVLDNYYLELEKLPSVASTELIRFIINYSKNYLNKEYTEESIRNMNKYSIKRIITEETLETLDALSANPEDVYQWYAVFSTQASQYRFWDNKNRKVRYTTFHYNWAVSASFQHIKSEVIVKLHRICNLLK